MSRMCQIKASAGSGKTYTLTQQYLQLMTRMQGGCSASPLHGACGKKPTGHDCKVGDILAITFTNAAVNEIRKRVIENLKKIAFGKMDASAMGLDKERARQCLDALMDNMEEMNVRTIDSLLHQIVRSAALSLGLNPDFEPVFNAPQAVKPYLDKYMEEAFLGDADKMNTIRFAVETFLKHVATDKVWPLILSRSLAKELESLLDDVLLRKYSSPHSTAKGSGANPGVALMPYSDYKEVEEAHDNYLEAVLENGRKLRDLIDEHNSNPANKKKIKCKNDLKKFFQELDNGSVPAKIACLDKSLSENLYKGALDNCDAQPFETLYNDITQNFIAYKACREHLKYSRILSLGDTVVEEYKKDFRQAAALPSILFPLLAQKALSLDDGVSDALCRLGTRLSHFLIDEFQDTSLGQWEGISSLVKEALANNGSLTWVGDVKQSIFMWRHASPELFDKLKKDEELVRMVNEVEEDSLPYNRRSARNIVVFNNELFDSLNTNAIGSILASINSSLAVNKCAIDNIQQAFADCRQDLPPDADSGGLVAVKEIGDKDFLNNFGEELITFIRERVEEKKEIAYSDMLILVRANKDASILAEALAGADIPVITENSLLLNGEELIKESIALLEFLLNPENDQALLYVLAGEGFLAHPDLQALSANDFYSLAFEKGDKSLYKHFRDKYPELWEKFLKPFYKNSTLIPPYDVIREWYNNMGLERRFSHKRIFLSAFLEYLHRAELAGYNSISAFLEHWYEEGVESKAIMPDGVDAVRIMTIHKAKGLQAPVVLVPLKNSAMKTQATQSGKRIQYQVGDLTLNVRLLKSFAKEYEGAILRDAQEILNMMYVAFTRAEKELHIYISDKKGEPSLMASMMSVAKMKIPYEQGEPWVDEKLSNREKGGEMQEESPERAQAEIETASFPWISKLKVARNTLFAEGDSAKKRGTFIHFCLENMHLTGDPEKDVQKAYDFALSHSGLELTEEELKGVKEGLLWFASQKEARDWLERGWPEQAMLDREGNELRMDLLVPHDWGALVIDYKSGSRDEKNKEQMRTYLRCLKESGEFGDKVCGLLVYLDERKFVPLDLEWAGEVSESCPGLPYSS